MAARAKDVGIFLTFRDLRFLLQLRRTMHKLTYIRIDRHNSTKLRKNCQSLNPDVQKIKGQLRHAIGMSTERRRPYHLPDQSKGTNIFCRFFVFCRLYPFYPPATTDTNTIAGVGLPKNNDYP
jgi:hypothetical protein